MRVAQLAEYGFVGLKVESSSLFFHPVIGQWVNLVAFHEYGDLGAEEVINRLRRKNYPLHHLILPHDVKARNPDTAEQSRLRMFRDAELGSVNVLKRVSDESSLANVRLLLPSCRFDSRRTEHGVNRLKQVQYEYNAKTDTVLNKISHDDASHGYDSFKYLANWIAKRYPQRKDGRNFQSKSEKPKVKRTIRARRAG